MAIKRVKDFQFSFVETGSLTQEDEDKLRRLTKNINQQIRKKYAEDSENPAFDAINNARYIMTGKEAVGAPTLSFRKSMSVNEVSDLLDIITYAQGELYTKSYHDKGLTTTFEAINKSRLKSGDVELSDFDKYRLGRIFESDEFAKLKELREYGSDTAINGVEKMISEALFSSSEVIDILSDFLKEKEKGSLVAYVDQRIRERKYAQTSGGDRT